MLREVQRSIIGLNVYSPSRLHIVMFDIVYELLVFWLLICTLGGGGPGGNRSFFQHKEWIRCFFQSRGKIICQHRLELSVCTSSYLYGHKLCASCVKAALCFLKWRKGSCFTPAWALCHCLVLFRRFLPYGWQNPAAKKNGELADID